MQIERLQGLYGKRQLFRNEGQAFPFEERPRAAFIVKSILRGALPPESQGIQAMNVLLRHAVERLGESRPMACVKLLTETVLDDCLHQAESSFDRRRFDMFIMFHDTAFGLSQALGRIGTAEQQIADNNNTAFDMMLHTVPEKSIPDITEQTEAYMVVQEEGRYCMGLLSSDPTGTKLLEDFIERLKQDHKSPFMKRLLEFSEVPEFIIAGAEVALDYYKMVYPLSE